MAADTSTRPGEPTRTGEGADGFPHESKYPLFVGAGLFFSGVGLSMWLPVLVVGVPLLLYGAGGWTWEYTVEEFERGVVPRQKHQLLGMKSGYIAMILLIAGELLIFAGLFVAWFYLDAERGPFPVGGLPAPSFTYGAVMTALMIVGSIAFAWARSSINRDARGRFNTGLALALLTGLGFLGALWIEWSRLMAEGLTWTAGPYGAAYYVLTGVHAAHLLGGLALGGVVAYRAWGRGHFSSKRHLMVATTEAYWHFLTFVSVLILAFVYFPTSA